MVDFEFRVKKEDLLKNLKAANDEVIKVQGEGEHLLQWGENNLMLKIQENFFMADFNDDQGWITVDGSDFSPEMLVVAFETNPELATEEVLLALFRAVGMK